MVVRLLIAALLLGHAAIHLAFLAPRPATAAGPHWPFDVERSWATARLGVPLGLVRAWARFAIGILVATSAVAAVAVFVGAMPLAAMAAGLGAVMSLAILVAFPDRFLVLGVLIDLVILWLVLVGDWSSRSLPG